MSTQKKNAPTLQERREQPTQEMMDWAIQILKSFQDPTEPFNETRVYRAFIHILLDLHELNRLDIYHGLSGEDEHFVLYKLTHLVEEIAEWNAKQASPAV